MDPLKSRPPIPLDPHARGLLAQWVTAHWDGVYALAFRLSRDRNEADDLAQEAFLKAAIRRDSFADGTNLRAWLLRIMTNAFLDGRRRKQTSSSEPLVGDPVTPNRAPVEKMANSELKAALAAAIGELPETARAVFLLRTQEEMSFKDIAETIGTSEETARWHMMQARRGLMKKMDGWM